MAAFLGDIAFLLGTAIAAAGLLTLHRAGTDPRPVLLKVAGAVLLLAGTGTAACTAFYYFKYRGAGDLDHPYPIFSGTMGMGGGAMPSAPLPAQPTSGPGGPAASGTSDAEHAAHHPDAAADAAQ